MLKKLISFVCCLLPIGAVADVYSVSATGEEGTISLTDSATNVLDSSVTENVKDVIDGGDTLRIDAGMTLDAGSSFSVNGGMHVGAENVTNTSNNLYVMDTANSAGNFIVSTTGQVSVGTVLEVLNAWDLTISDNGNATSSFGANSVVIGTGSKLMLANLGEVAVGTSVGGNGDFVVENVGNVNIGSVNTTGTVSITGADLVNLVGLVSENDTKIESVGNINVTGDGTTGGISNSGKMVLNAGVDIFVAGNLENTGDGAPSLEITAGRALTVNGTMKNDSANGEMELDVESWTVKGADVNGYSFVNNGDFTATVTGETNLAGGFNIENMGVDNTFDLTTGQLVLGANNLISNKLNSFNLSVTDGNLALDTLVNKSGNMTVDVPVGDFSADYILNQRGRVDLFAQSVGLGGGVIDGVKTSIETDAGAITTLTARGMITAEAGISNQGTLNMYAPTLVLNSVANAGAGSVLNIGARLGANGLLVGNSVQITNNLSNAAGIVNVYANDISVGGQLVSDGGETTVKGTNLTFGGVDVNGGKLYLDSTQVDVNDDFDVTVGGMVNLSANSANVAGLTVADTFNVAGDIVYGGTTGMLNVEKNQSTISAKKITVGGNIDLSVPNYGAILASNSVQVDGNVSVGQENDLTVGDAGAPGTSGFNVGGDLSVEENATATIYSYIVGEGSVTVKNNGLMKLYGTSLVATNGDIDIAGSVRFDEETTEEKGLALVGVSDLFVMQTKGADSNINLGSINVDDKKVLNILAANDVSVANTVDNEGVLAVSAAGDASIVDDVTNDGTLNISAANITATSVDNNAGSVTLTATDIVLTDSIENDAVFTVDASNITAGSIVHNAGTMDFDALVLTADSVAINAGVAKFKIADIDIKGDLNVLGDLTQNGISGALNLVGAQTVDADNLKASGAFIAESGDSIYNIETNISLGDVQVANTAAALFYATDFITQNGITNSGDLTVAANQIQAGVIVNESGFLDLQAQTILGSSVTVNGGNVLLTGDNAAFDGAITSGGVLAQNEAGNIKINADSYVLTAGNIEVAGINQTGVLTINSSDVNVAGDINATALKIAANPMGNWANVNVDGSVSGNVNFVGLEKMTIGGDYTFNGNSTISAAILPYATGTGINTTDINYWASVSLQDDDTFGKITNAADAAPLISVGGKFMSDVDIMKLGDIDSPNLEGSQVGITVFDMFDAGTAIWLLHADGGVTDLSSKIRNINVKFCNADASICAAYYGEWPAYISVRDSDGDANPDSLYVVFDNRFGGPVEVFGIQPIVDRDPEHTDGEFIAAGALDEMIAGQLENNKFFNRTPIEVIPEVFKDTNLSDVANELYNRMEDYVLNRDGAPLTAFSRLFQVHEIERIAGSVALNEHTSFRSFEDRMIDEFIWNRNRRLDKVWMDVDYGMFYQNTVDGHHADGHRFSVSGGYDWQQDDKTIFGFMGRVSHTSSGATDSMDLSYGTVSQMGNINLDVTDTDIGVGAYMLKTLNEKNRLYGNAFLDAHLFDVEREQTFVADISGNGTAFSLISEWGLLHDILNQYIVGNLYARMGYNFGFDVKEESAGDEYMRLQSDGYFILTPGYSLTAQKRIYPSAWFQIRPYASIGVEYDVFGMPDKAEYKFAVANGYTDYDINVDPLWANIGGGIEFLSATGVHVGIDYRYQYNSDIQLHNIKVSGMYRF